MPMRRHQPTWEKNNVDQGKFTWSSNLPLTSSNITTQKWEDKNVRNQLCCDLTLSLCFFNTNIWLNKSKLSLIQSLIQSQSTLSAPDPRPHLSLHIPFEPQTSNVHNIIWTKKNVDNMSMNNLLCQHECKCNVRPIVFCWRQHSGMTPKFKILHLIF